MRRFAVLAAVALAALAPDRAAAQPALPGSIHIIEAKVEKDKLTWEEIRYSAVTKEEEVTVNINGMNVKQKRAVTVLVPVSETRAVELKAIKATDAAGKAIDADKLAELLKEKTAVVVVPAALPEKHRKLFKDTTVFVELPAAKGPLPPVAPVAPGAPVPLAPIPPAPPGGKKPPQ